jgi:hypothetical protein
MPRIVCSLTLATVLVLAGSVLASGTDGIDITAGFGPHQWPGPLRDRLTTGMWSWLAVPDQFGPDVAVPLRAAVPEHATILIGDCFMPSSVIEAHADQPYWPGFEQLTYGEWRAAVERAAAEIDAVVVPTYAALNGPDGAASVDPAFVLRLEPFRINEAGHRFLAELFRQHDGFDGRED